MMCAHRKQLIFCFLATTLCCGSLFAHQDTIIRLEGKTLVGLPIQYSPAELDLEALRLRIGRHVMVFSPLLRSFFLRQPYDLQVLASWHHKDEEGSLPPYLTLHITPKGRDYSYGVTLALDTLRLINISVALRGSAGPPETMTMQAMRIALSDFEKKEIADSIKNVR